jgi:hypothetical protein
MFGCSPQQISQASTVLRALATEWRELLAGSDGFLTGGRRGLDRREIAWGEMDSFVSLSRIGTWGKGGVKLTCWIGARQQRELLPLCRIGEGELDYEFFGAC